VSSSPAAAGTLQKNVNWKMRIGSGMKCSVAVKRGRIGVKK